MSLAAKAADHRSGWAQARRKFFDLARLRKGPDRYRGGGAYRRPVRRRAQHQRLTAAGAPS